MKRWISMLLALMMMMSMATAEETPDDDAWEREIVGYAIARARIMDVEARSPEYAERWESMNGTMSDEIKAALANIDHTMPQKVFVSETGQSSAWTLVELSVLIGANQNNLTVAEWNIANRYMTQQWTNMLEILFFDDGVETADRSACVQAFRQTTPLGTVYAGDAPENGLMLLYYPGQCNVLVHWYTENGCVSVQVEAANFQSDDPTAGDVSLYYTVPFEEFDPADAVLPTEQNQAEEPDATYIQQCAFEVTESVQGLIPVMEKLGMCETDGLVPWNIAEEPNVQVTLYPAEKLAYSPWQLHNQIALAASPEATFLTAFNMMDRKLFPCTGAGGLLALIPETGTPIVVSWQPENGAAVFWASYAPLDVLEEMLMKEEEENSDSAGGTSAGNCTGITREREIK